jgi:hypothetical protein
MARTGTPVNRPAGSGRDHVRSQVREHVAEKLSLGLTALATFILSSVGSRSGRRW